MLGKSHGHSNAIYSIRRVTRVLALVILLLVGAGFFLPTDYRVERSVVIDASAANILDVALGGRNLPLWMHVQNGRLRDSQGELSVGQSVAIEYQDKAEQGDLTLLSVGPSQFTFDVRPKPNVNLVQNQIRFLSVPQGTQVMWQIEGNLDAGFIGPYLALFANDMAGKNFEISLQKLKKLVENQIQ
ncbi:SRPBCC family protein [Marinomonas sp. TW1]|uniref:SRPBCC family protein n=1 Tax=Marinomonas sp. TW1 TaxID=1561203 RepID=UPI0007AF9881|nr:SRPBCC family protein [Marinomonas sp. TW1]KZN12689.1 polyketide cyclase [Marinomonas sp. TW1]